MKRNRHRLSRFVAARIPAVRAARAWSDLLNHWMPDQSDLEELDARPREHRQAVRVLMYGIPYTDPRWDVLVALLEWERREERKRRDAADELTRLSEEMDRTGGPIDITGMITDNVVSMDVEYERLRRTDETTIETELPRVDWAGNPEGSTYHSATQPLCPPGECTWPDCNCQAKAEFTLVPSPKGPKWYTVRTLRSIREEQMRDE